MSSPHRSGIFRKPEIIKNVNNDQGSFDIQGKAKRISDLFSSLADSSPSGKNLSSEDGTSPKSSPAKAQPRSQEEFCERVNSFKPGLWTVDQVSPLECAIWGWKLLEKDVLQCVTCQEVVCALLPNRKDKEAYEKFFEIFKNRLSMSHKDACGWLCNPCPREFMDPLSINTEELRNMKNNVQTLVSLNSALPFVNNNRLTALLGADDELIKGLLKSNDIDDEAKVTAVLIILCGWSKGQGHYLRCSICRRLVGLWSLISIADEFKKNAPFKEIADTNTRKRKLSEPNDNTSEAPEDNLRVTRQSPRKSKNQETTDMPTPKRMKTRSHGDNEDDQDAQKNGHKKECLLITSPTTQVEKVEKRYFTPLEEHRHWCPWIAKIEQDVSEGDEDEDPSKGFCLVTEQVRMLLQMLEQRKSVSQEKYVENVEGLRIIRNLLDEVTSE